ncbi:MAG: hypothetical protein GC160_02365 [Acidobacteria bacterium]|nr:hypothetical protein [Acidobacteriota bacterium]
MSASRVASLSWKPQYNRVGAFARTAALWLGQSGALVFNDSRSEPYSFQETKTRWGSTERGVELVDRTDETDRGHYTMSYRSVRVRSYGFGPEIALEALFGEDSATLSVVVGDEAAAAGVLAAFEATTEGRSPQPPPAKRAAPLDSSRLNTRAANFLRAEHYDEAAQIAAVILEQAPGDRDAAMTHAVALAGKGDARAEAELLRILAADPSCADAFYHLGKLMLSLSNAAAAAKYLQGAVTAAPGYHAAQARLGAALESLGRRAEALAAYEAAVAARPSRKAPYGEEGADLTQSAHEGILRLSAP